MAAKIFQSIFSRSNASPTSDASNNDLQRRIAHVQGEDAVADRFRHARNVVGNSNESGRARLQKGNNPRAADKASMPEAADADAILRDRWLAGEGSPDSADSLASIFTAQVGWPGIKVGVTISRSGSNT